jgi:DNA-directed RNA polymerase specialized sigma24 family protein
MAAKKEHYVNNKEFLAAMVEYKKGVDKAKKNNLTKPPVTDYIGECFLKIANHLSYRPNFINYTYRDDMISDGIENCLQYLDNFDGEKSNNPFAYFTQIIYYAFIRRIQKEKKQSHVKHMMIQKQDYVPFVTNPGDDTIYSIGGFDPNIMVPDEAVYKPKKKETNKEPSGLENFMEKDKE